MGGEYFHDNGQFHLKGNYLNDLKEGLWEWYDRNGVKEKSLYENNIKVGVWESYHVNGELRGKGNYLNGQKDGVWESFYDNGQLRKKGTYKNGDREGELEYYDVNGEKEKTLHEDYNEEDVFEQEILDVFKLISESLFKRMNYDGFAMPDTINSKNNDTTKNKKNFFTLINEKIISFFSNK